MENLELLLEQANNGDAVAQYKVGRAYESGDGVDKNIATARSWYQKSADNGYKNAEVKLKLLPIQEEATSETAVIADTPSQAKTGYTPPPAPSIATPSGATSNFSAANDQNVNLPANTQTVTGPKSKVAAILLALFLGGFGAHDFYLGYTKQGVIKLVLTITMFFSFVTYFWTIIDIIRILCNGKLDKNGQLLK